MVPAGGQSSRIGVERVGSRTACVAVASFLCLAALPAQVAAQNLVSNPNLTSGLTGWDTGVNASFDPAQGSPSPGSVLFSATLVAPIDFDQAGVMDQCVGGIVAGETYSFGGQVRLTTIPAGAVAIVAIVWNSGPACDVSELAIEAGVPVSATGSFQTTTWSAVAPPGATSVEFNVLTGIASIGPGPVADPGVIVFVPGTYSAHMDSLFLQVVPDVPTMGAWWFVTLALVLAFVAAKAVRSSGRATT